MAVFSDLGTCRSIDPLQDMTAQAVGLQLLMVSNGSNVKNKLLLDSETGSKQTYSTVLLTEAQT